MGCILKGSSGLWSRLSVGAVLVATGGRIDGRSAWLLELGGVPLVLRALIALSGAGVDELAVVVASDDEAIERVVQAFPIHVVRDDAQPGRAGAPAPLAAAASALRLGLAALSPRLDAVIAMRSPLPLVDAQDVTALIGAFKKRGDAVMVMPRDATGAAGHALIIDAATRDAWRDGRVDAACLDGDGAVAARAGRLDVAHGRWHATIDTGADLASFAARTGHALAWPPATRAPVHEAAA